MLMHETHGTSNTLAVKPYSDLGEGGPIEMFIEKRRRYRANSKNSLVLVATSDTTKNF